jgi:hypothetical protein
VALPDFDNLATTIVMSGSAVTQDGYMLDTFSAWYILPQKRLTLQRTSDEELVMLIANPI